MNKRQIGSEAEERVRFFLEGQGYEILEQNYTCKQGEIDLIARKDGWLIFLEVKYRTSLKSGYPEEAVDLRKQRKIAQCAAWYLMEHGLGEDTPCRFDVASVTKQEIRMVEQAFEV